ncbi:hypothetical protein OU997_16190 [Pseudomonas sp. SL4(2022)]|uniref:hypothetical protein n=1 Tax=Pseudomonas sp. SL4(2022) TaxID=2994661 RepID=UPI00226F2F94|nr:hypothetical protein [Pseudomonas sp. SL4(2022)]WAC43775.1 hypothetical protein OU997_16190 [Pseudomonas sp. SL4(2022)]
MPLIVGLTPPEVRHHYDALRKQPCHDLVLKPLIKSCENAYVYGLKKDNPLYIKNKKILISDQGKFKFNLEMECIAAHEELWNSCAWKRGSIVFILKNDNFNYINLFPHCHAPGLSTTPNSGNTPSAIKKCKEAALSNMTALLLPASNGIEWMQIYSTETKTNEYYDAAKSLCQNTNY